MTEYSSIPVANRDSAPARHIRAASDSATDVRGNGDPALHNRPDADPIKELATVDSNSQDNRPDRPHLAVQPGPKPGFGPNPTAEKLVGNPDIGIDPREAAGAWRNGPEAP